MNSFRDIDSPWNFCPPQLCYHAYHVEISNSFHGYQFCSPAPPLQPPPQSQWHVANYTAALEEALLSAIQSNTQSLSKKETQVGKSASHLEEDELSRYNASTCFSQFLEDTIEIMDRRNAELDRVQRESHKDVYEESQIFTTNFDALLQSSIVYPLEIELFDDMRGVNQIYEEESEPFYHYHLMNTDFFQPNLEILEEDIEQDMSIEMDDTLEAIYYSNKKEEKLNMEKEIELKEPIESREEVSKHELIYYTKECSKTFELDRYVIQPFEPNPSIMLKLIIRKIEKVHKWPYHVDAHFLQAIKLRDGTTSNPSKFYDQYVRYIKSTKVTQGRWLNFPFDLGGLVRSLGRK